MSEPLSRLLEIMARLRSREGCPWDRAQTFATIAPYTIEEAYEVADAIERGDVRELQSELGDLLFQVVFHARIASEAGHFDFDAVAASIADKLVRRHPHVFAGAQVADAAAQSDSWERIKAEERRRAAGAAGSSVVGGVPRALPALTRTHKLGKRAAQAGFDFPGAREAADKVAEELAEALDAAAAGPPGSARVAEEVGDLLFAAANLARKLEVDPETALRAANAKFERRIRGMEDLAARAGTEFASLDLDAQERLWRETKRGE